MQVCMPPARVRSFLDGIPGDSFLFINCSPGHNFQNHLWNGAINLHWLASEHCSADHWCGRTACWAGIDPWDRLCVPHQHAWIFPVVEGVLVESSAMSESWGCMLRSCIGYFSSPFQNTVICAREFLRYLLRPIGKRVVLILSIQWFVGHFRLVPSNCFASTLVIFG